jgi:hypothetical protein
MRIFARSPFIIDIDGTGGTTTTLELYIWNGTGSAPTTPTYSISKNVASASLPMTYYNISPYIQEFISHLETNYVSGDGYVSVPNNEWCNVEAQLYVDRDNIENRLYRAFDGYGYYGEGTNPQLSSIMMSQNTTYYYHKDIYTYLPGGITISTPPSSTAIFGIIYYDADTTNVIWSDSGGLASDSVVNVPPSFSDIEGYKNTYIEIDMESQGSTYLYFKQIEECKYEPVVVDFINKFGAWQRMFLFKASYNSIETTQDEFNYLQSDLVDYDVLEGQRRQFNTNGKETIKANSGWVAEDFKVQIQELVLSERILVNNKPAKTRTKSLDLVKHVNQKMINYTLEFEFNYDTINSVI